jgi:hypothetical protein
VLPVAISKIDDMSTLNDYYFSEGEKHADDYEEKELLALLDSNDINEVYQALGSIGKRKLQSALPMLQNMALYDDDMGVQEMAIRTIRRIGRRKALDILDFLRTTEHKDLIDRVIKYGYNIDL